MRNTSADDLTRQWRHLLARKIIKSTSYCTLRN